LSGSPRIPTFLAGFATAEIVGTCEKLEDPSAPVWSKVHLENVEAIGCGTIASDPESGQISPHIHTSLGIKDQGAMGHTSHLISAHVLFLTELLIVEVASPTMRRERNPDLYDVPLLTFGVYRLRQQPLPEREQRRPRGGRRRGGRVARGEGVEQVGAVRRHQQAGGLGGVGRRVRGVAQQALDQPSRIDERVLEATGDGGILARGVVDRAQQATVAGEQVDEAVDHLADEFARSRGAAALQPVDEGIVGIGQQLGGEAGEVVEMAVEDRPRQPRLGHQRADGELGERTLGEQRSRGGEDPRSGDLRRDVWRAS
jgi:hypothetical protein